MKRPWVYMREHLSHLGTFSSENQAPKSKIFFQFGKQFGEFLISNLHLRSPPCLLRQPVQGPRSTKLPQMGSKCAPNLDPRAVPEFAPKLVPNFAPRGTKSRPKSIRKLFQMLSMAGPFRIVLRLNFFGRFFGRFFGPDHVFFWRIFWRDFWVDFWAGCLAVTLGPTNNFPEARMIGCYRYPTSENNTLGW